MDAQTVDRNRLQRRCATKGPQLALHHCCHRANRQKHLKSRIEFRHAAGEQIIDLFAHHIPHNSIFVVCPAEKALLNKGCCIGSSGRLAGDGTTAQVVGMEQQEFTGPDRCTRSQELCSETMIRGTYEEGEGLVVHYERSHDGSGKTQMPGTMATIYRQGMGDKVALITDKRFSGAIRSFRAGNASPASGGRTVLIKDGDIILVNTLGGTSEPHVSDVVLSARRKNCTVSTNSFTSGCMWEQARSVGLAAISAMTPPEGQAKVVCHAD